jgi:D-threo-aldose 1-dehydrogenase
VVGLRTADQVRQAVDRHTAAVPPELWTDLVDRGLLAPEAHPDAFA